MVSKAVLKSSIGHWQPLMKGGTVVPMEVIGLLLVQTAVFVLRQLVSVLKYLRSKNIVHRDFKPASLMFHINTGEVKVIDFGLAQWCKPGEKITDTAGTPIYMGPEQFLGAPYDPFGADLWSVMVSIYDMIEGETPFDDEFAIMHEHPINPKRFRNTYLHDLVWAVIGKKNSDDRLSLDEVDSQLQTC
ncbi:hypothetical protein HK102_003420 [Quaeritorhiza haematococci]|nr:hypothetical protein HK102_003420 [Quaeritorhiza haematococci]